MWVRLLSVLSRRRDHQNLNSIEILSAFLGRGVDRKWSFGASLVEGDFSYHILSVPQITISRLSVLSSAQDNCSLSRLTKKMIGDLRFLLLLDLVD